MQISVNPFSGKHGLFPELTTSTNGTQFIVSTVVADRYLIEHDISADFVQRCINRILKIDKWAVNREASLRGWEIFGYTDMAQKITDKIKINA